MSSERRNLVFVFQWELENEERQTTELRTNWRIKHPIFFRLFIDPTALGIAVVWSVHDSRKSSRKCSCSDKRSCTLALAPPWTWTIARCPRCTHLKRSSSQRTHSTFPSIAWTFWLFQWFGWLPKVFEKSTPFSKYMNFLWWIRVYNIGERKQNSINLIHPVFTCIRTLFFNPFFTMLICSEN